MFWQEFVYGNIYKSKDEQYNIEMLFACNQTPSKKETKKKLFLNYAKVNKNIGIENEKQFKSKETSRKSFGNYGGSLMKFH